MNRTYNISMALGLTLLTAGTAMYSVRLALIVCGLSMIGLTVLTVMIMQGGR